MAVIEPSLRRVFDERSHDFDVAEDGDVVEPRDGVGGGDGDGEERHGGGRATHAPRRPRDPLPAVRVDEALHRQHQQHQGRVDHRCQVVNLHL